MKKFLTALIDFFSALFNKSAEGPQIKDGGEDFVEDNNKPIKDDVNMENTILGTTEKKSIVKILIDNGHGADTEGKRSPYSMSGVKPAIPFFEYQWNREIAQPLVERLCKLGYDATLIVTETNDVSLKERVARINKVCNEVGAGNVVMVSVHSNAMGNGDKWMTARGWSAYTTKGQTNSDRVADFLYDAAEKNLAGMKIRTDKSDGDRDIEDNFYIIKNAYCPAVLTENFFYDNVDDINFILSDEGRERIIQTHIDGIVAYLNYLGR